MSLSTLVSLYLLIGLGCGVAVARRTGPPLGRAILSGFVTVPLWPLWAPWVLTAARPGASAPAPTAPGAGSVPSAVPSSQGEAPGHCIHRIGSSLREVLLGLEGSPLLQVLSPTEAEQLGLEVEQACARLNELEARIQVHGLEPSRLQARLDGLEQAAASPQAIAAARRQLETGQRLRALCDRQRGALAELADLVELVRTQLLLASVSTSAGVEQSHGDERVAELATELWAKLEGLRELATMELLGSSSD